MRQIVLGSPTGFSSIQAPQPQNATQIQEISQTLQYSPQPAEATLGPTQPLNSNPAAFLRRPSIGVDSRQDPIYGARQGPHSAPPLPTSYMTIVPAPFLTPQVYAVPSIRAPQNQSPAPAQGGSGSHSLPQYMSSYPTQQTVSRPSTLTRAMASAQHPAPTPMTIDEAHPPSATPSQSNGSDTEDSPWRRSDSIRKCASEIVDLFTNEAVKLQEEVTTSVFKTMNYQLMQEREARAKLEGRVRELEEELARITGRRR